MRESILCPEAKPYIGGAILLCLLVALLYWPLLPLPLILLLFFLWFFRNPHRENMANAQQLVSPADGKVMSITTVDDPFVGEGTQKITIFLSVFNVHVNRTPADGLVKYYHYRPGKFLPAYKPHASEENERATLGIEMEDGFRYKVRQITGILARRIVCDLREGMETKQGARFGMIKFGSCTELLVPATAHVLVHAGDIVRGTKTILVEKV